MVDKKLDKLNEETRMELIDLYEEFIKNPSGKEVHKKALELGGTYANASDAIFYETILKGINRIDDIVIDELSVEEAEKILQKLKKK